MRGKPLFSEGRSWHGPYANYDEAFGKAKEMSPCKALKSTAAFAIPNTRPDIGTGGAEQTRGPQLRIER